MSKILIGLFLCSLRGFAADAEEVCVKKYVGQKIRIDIDTTQSDKLLYVIPFEYNVVKKVYGKLKYWDTDSVVVEIDSKEIQTKTIKSTSIKSIYMLNGHRRKVLSGAAIGAGSGLILLVLTTMGDSFDPDKEKLIEKDPLHASAIFIGGGAVIGGVIGSFSKAERWRKLINGEMPVELGLGKSQKCLQIRFSYRF